jgi:DNA (cytosine-5)-methyltransferase 1
MTLTIGSLFSGIGGLELGLEWAGLGPTLWQVEISEPCRRVLARHWPEAERHEDVRSVGAATLAPVDLVCGGFPCQNLSHANIRTRSGLEGAQSGLWTQYARVVEEIRPRAAVVENIADGWRRWVPVVRRDLGRLGYASVPLLLRASDVGAPHQRARVFVVAKSYGDGESARAVHAQMAKLPATSGTLRKKWRRPSPRALGVADGVSECMERLHQLGNAVVPQCAQVIGHVIRQLLEEQT